MRNAAPAAYRHQCFMMTIVYVYPASTGLRLNCFKASSLPLCYDSAPWNPLFCASAGIFVIRLQNVYKDYGGRPALINVNLHIGLGEFAFLVGPSGAGKSTLMRLLYREEAPTSGTVFVGGVDITKLRGRQIPLLR